jgi:ABC-type multidrug transport system fused ATPase/permease subunit
MGRALTVGEAMLIASEWHVGEVFLSMLWFFMFFIFIWLLFTVFGDIFRDRKMSGWAKAAWVIFVIIFPFLGILIYLIARGGSMHERAVAQQTAAKQQFDSYVQQVAATQGGGSTASVADELTRLANLKEQGVISDEEFASLKAKALASS